MRPPDPLGAFAEALESLDALIPAATKQYLLALDEPGLRREHWGLRIAIRSVLGLGRDDSPLTRWFRARGVTSPETMSDEILRAYWRRLRGRGAAPESRHVAGAPEPAGEF